MEHIASSSFGVIRFLCYFITLFLLAVYIYQEQKQLASIFCVLKNFLNMFKRTHEGNGRCRKTTG